MVEWLNKILFDLSTVLYNLKIHILKIKTIKFVYYYYSMFVVPDRITDKSILAATETSSDLL